MATELDRGIHVQHQPKPTIDEPVADFDISELFVSYTDKRGVIEYGNPIFERLSGYPLSELIGAPHRILRHPDMPKGVFYQMWSMLKEGEPFAGYVKNRAADGRYYWVFAVTCPTQEGYLSVRIKPTTQLLMTVQEIYAKLLRAENEDGVTPEQSAQNLLKAISKLGIDSYRDFMSEALSREYSARHAAMGLPENVSMTSFVQAAELLKELSGEVGKVTKLFKTISGSPLNLSILASRLSDMGAPMKVVASNYRLIIGELVEQVDQMSSELLVLLDRAQFGRIGNSAHLLLQEAIEHFEEEATGEVSELSRKHGKTLSRIRDEFRTQGINGRDRIEKTAEGFELRAKRLRKLLSGLAVTRVTCSIEAAGITEDTSSIDEIAVHLRSFQDQLGPSLDFIADACASVVKLVRNRRTTAL